MLKEADDHESTAMVRMICGGRFCEVLEASTIFKRLRDACRESVEAECLASEVSKCKEKCPREELLCVSVASLLLFMQQNFTGPPLDAKTEAKIVPPTSQKDALDELVLAGEDIGYNIKSAFLLVLARAILRNGCEESKNEGCDSEEKGDNSVVGVKVQPPLNFCWHLWTSRMCVIHQKLFNVNVPQLQRPSLQGYQRCVELISGLETSKLHPGFEELAVGILLECVQCYLIYFKTKDAHRILERAISLSKFHLSETGMLGKRTKFQVDSKVQLVINCKSDEKRLSYEQSTVWPFWSARLGTITPSNDMRKGDAKDKAGDKSESNDNDGNCQFSGVFPEIAPLDSEYLLEHIKLDAKAEKEKEKLIDGRVSLLDRAIMILKAISIRKQTMGGDVIAREQCLALLYTAIHKSPSIASGGRSWGVFSSLLYHRAMWEAIDSEMSTRSLVQLENHYRHLQHEVKSVSLSACFRLSDAFISCIQPSFKIALSLADGYKKMNMLQSALDEFTKLQCWPEMIRCSILLGRKGAAEEMLLSQIKSIEEKSSKTTTQGSRSEKRRMRELARMYCFLGICKNDPEYFLKSWLASGKSYPKAKRLLGQYYLDRREWKECIIHYRDALEINPIHLESWYNQGIAAMECKDYDVAKVAFSRVVTLDSEKGEAWNNLAAVHLHVKNYKEALGALEYAVKHKRKNWKVWENYLTTALNLKELPKAYLGLQHCVQIRREKAVQADIIELLTAATLKETLPKIENAIQKNKAANDVDSKLDCNDNDKAKADKQKDEKGDRVSNPDSKSPVPSTQNSKHPYNSAQEMRLRKLGLGPGSSFRLYDKCLLRCTSMVSHPSLWGARASLYELINDYDTALEYRESEMQGLQAGSWYESKTRAEDVIKAAGSMVQCYLAKDQKTAARLFVKGIERRVKLSDNLSADETFMQKVQKLVDTIPNPQKSAEKKKRSTSAASFLSDWA